MLWFFHICHTALHAGHNSQTALKPITSIYKQAIKMMDQKPMRWHLCGILQMQDFFSPCIKLFFKCLHNHVSPLFCGLVKRRPISSRATQASTNGDCIVPTCTNSFGQSALSVRGVNMWNALPTVLKLETDNNVFHRGLKLWLKSNQLCSHG